MSFYKPIYEKNFSFYAIPIFFYFLGSLCLAGMGLALDVSFGGTFFVCASFFRRCRLYETERLRV